MKIIVTGCTALHCGRVRKYLSTLELVVKGLRELGHRVDQRPVEPLSDLSGYDFAVIGIYKYDALNVTAAWYRFGAVWAASQLPFGVVIDDHNWGATSRSWKWLWRPNMAGKRTLEWMAKIIDSGHKNALDRVNDKWKESMDRVLFPVFNWGNHRILTDMHPVDEPYFWDPSPLVVSPYRRTPSILKRKKWVIASLQQVGRYVDDLDLTWGTVDFYRKHAQRNGSWGRVDEEDVVSQYDRNWGVVSFPYRHSGSGWWRSRFNFCADMGCVMLADSSEVRRIGDAFLVRADEIEEMFCSELKKLAERQRRQLREHQLRKNECLHQLNKFVSDK